jgi:hypothetical protein
MSSDVTCEKMREIGAELALGVLSGRERAEAVAHLDQCADCREYVENLTVVGDKLIGLLPDSPPPPGFETKVARRLAQDAPAHEKRRRNTQASGLGHDLRGRARRARLRLASAVAAFAVACGLAGWGISTAVESVTASPPPAVETEPVLVGDFTSAHAAHPVGEMYIHPGASGWVFVTVDLTGPHASFTGTVTCLLERTDGTKDRVGDFTVRDGHGDWAVQTAVNPKGVSGAHLMSSDGTVLATAQLKLGQVQTPEEV